MEEHNTWAWGSYLPAAIILGTVWMHGFALLAQPGSSKLKLDTGQEIFQAGCVSCHGIDGKGQSQNLAGFERPSTFPDFADCPTATPEPDVQWRAVITNGGPARGFSQIMPSFKDLLTAEQIDKVIGYLRSLCTEPVWPLGSLNLPRALVTEKAFPEDETVISSSFNVQGAPGVTNMVVYEKRIGASGQLEAVVPYNFVHNTGAWASGFGDITLGYKRKLFHSMRTGTIFSAAGEVTVPSGDSAKGTGAGSTIFEAFAAYGQILPANTFVQVQTGTELPAHPDKVPRAYYLRTAVGKSFVTGDRGLGRIWSPMAEFIADRNFATGAKTNWDIIPQMQIPISKRMHILASLGLRIPMNNTAERAKQLMFYVLWDFVDGTLKQGW
jgi:mono/diheme cytochrome c family protein